MYIEACVNIISISCKLRHRRWWRSLQGTLMTLTQASIYRFWLPLWYLWWRSLQGPLMTLTQAFVSPMT
jgi:hypothetical protein